MSAIERLNSSMANPGSSPGARDRWDSVKRTAMKPIDEHLLRLDAGSPDGWTLPAGRCRACQAQFHPLRPRCPRCGAAELQETSLSKSGRLVSYTQVHQTNPASLIPAPYYVGIIQIDDGPIIEATGASALSSAALQDGARVKLVLEPVARDEDGQEIVTYRFLVDERKEGQK